MSFVEKWGAWLKERLGTMESPSGSNRQPFAAIAGHKNGLAWCMSTQVAAAKSVEVPLPDSASTRIVWHELVTEGRSHTGRPRRGDLVFYDWPGGNTPTDHVGWVASVGSDGLTMITYEGNTSQDDSGSQTNGGGLFQRHRSTTANVRGFARPDYPDERDIVAPEPEDDHDMKPVTYKVSVDPKNSKADIGKDGKANTADDDYGIWVTTDWVHTYQLGTAGDVHGRAIPGAYPAVNIWVPDTFHAEMLARS